MLAIPVTDHSFEDCRLMMEAKKLGMPMEAGLVEYYKLSPMIGYVSRLVEYYKLSPMIGYVSRLVEYYKLTNDRVRMSKVSSPKRMSKHFE